MMTLKSLRAWAQRHKTLLHFIEGMLFFSLAMTFFNAAMALFSTVPYGPEIMGGVILIMIAGFFWKGAFNYQNKYWEDRTALDIAMKLEERLSVLEDNVYVIEKGKI